MASICTLNHPNFNFLCKNGPIFHHQHLLVTPSSVSFSLCRLCHCAALKTGSESGGGIRSDKKELLRKPIGLESSELVKEEEEEEVEEVEEEEDGKKSGEDEESLVDWEDRILEDTVPLVGFMRMILHSGIYAVGDKLSDDHQRTILQRLLPHHPEYKKKIGRGVDYITVGYHPDFESSKCLFLVREDGEAIDFSYWKCIKGLIRKKYPLYAEDFIFRHFWRRKRGGD